MLTLLTKKKDVRNFFLIVSLTLTFFLDCNSQNLNWAYNIGDPNLNHTNADICCALTTDFEGNIYITGRFINTVNFNPEGTPFYLSSSNANVFDIYVAKYSSNFKLIWAINLGGSGNGIGVSIKTDSLQNIYLSGNYIGSIDFDPSSNTSFIDSDNVSSFLAKYNSNGQFEWVKEVECNWQKNEWFYGKQLFVDNSSNIYRYEKSTESLEKYDSFGNLTLKEYLKGSPVFDNNQFFYSFDNLTYNENLININSKDTIIFNKINLNGNKIKTKTISVSSDGDIGGFIYYDQKGNIILSGVYWGTCYFYGIDDTLTISNYDSVMVYEGIFNPIGREFIAKIDTLGNVKWVKSYHEKSPNPYIISINDNGDIFTLGMLIGSANFNPDGNTKLTSTSYGQHYIAKYDSSFNYLAGSLFLGGSYNDEIRGFEIYNDTAIIAGNFFNSIDMDLTSSNFLLSSEPSEDIFIAKYSEFDISTATEVSTKPQDSYNKIAVYPNPSSGLFNIGLKMNIGNSFINVYDLMGNKIYSNNINSDSFKLDLSQFKPGIYFLTIIQEKEKITVKLVLNRR